MSRILACLASFAALLLLAVPSQGADGKNITIRWHGQSFFEIVSPEGVKLVLDPHAIEQFGRKTVVADAILITHPHTDHNQIDVVENKAKAKKFEAVKNVGGDLAMRQDWVDVKETIKDVKITSLGTYHDNQGGMKRGKNGVWIIDIAGVRIVHLGDLGHTLTDEQLKKLGTVDVLMVPCGGVYTINGIDAIRVVEQVKPTRQVIPMHYGTPVYDALLDLKYFLEEADPKLVKRFKTNELVINAEEKPTGSYQISILHWDKIGK